MSRSSDTVSLLVALAALAGTSVGCAVSEGCDEVCGVARPTWETCMEEWGLAYGDGISLYESAEDFDNWCATYNRERRLLVMTADDPDSAEDALDARCEDQRSALETDGCAVYYSVFQEPRE